MSRDAPLGPTSAIVLGLLERGEATPYELKGMVAASVGNFWSVPHSALYAEPERLRRAGYLSVERERGGLRRKRYALTRQGRAALDEWREAPSRRLPELRDESLLKLFFDADPGGMAAAQRTANAENLPDNHARAPKDSGAPPRGPWRALEAGIAHEREWVRFWSKLADG